MLNGKKDLSILKNDKKMDMVTSRYPMFAEYQFNHSTIDGTIFYSATISRKETVFLKTYEMFDRERFDNAIDSIGTLKYFPNDKEPKRT